MPTAYGDVPLLVVEATPQLSPVAGVPSEAIAALHTPGSAVCVIVAGAVIVGG